MPGLTANLQSVGTTSWETLPPEQLISTLDDATAFLRNAAPETTGSLVSRLEFQVWSLANGRPMDPVLWNDLSQALRTLELSRFQGEKRDLSLEGFRIITRPLNPFQAPGVLVRGPAHLIKTRHLGSDLMEEFGKVVAQIWSSDREAGQQALRRWSQSGMEIQCFCSTKAERDFKVQALAAAGFDVRSAIIPWLATPKNFEFPIPSESIGNRYVVHWIAARRHELPLETWFREFIDAADRSPRHQIQHLDVLGRRDVRSDDPQLADDLMTLFGQPLSFAQFRQGFAIDVPGYTTNRVLLERHDGSDGVSLLTEITTLRGEIAARLSGWLPPPPAVGEPWIAWGDDLNEHLFGTTRRDQLLKHLSQGIGRRSLARILVFLHRLGVNALDMMARGHGLVFMPKIGFDFQDDLVRQKVLHDFQEFVEQRDSSISKATRAALQKVYHAWDICDFQNDRGEDLGLQFMTEYATQRKASILLRFQLSAHYAGWERLFSKQISMRPEFDPSTRNPAPDPALVDQAMQKRASQLAETPFFVDPANPYEAQLRITQLQEVALYMKEKAERAQTRADHDGLTGLLLRPAFLPYNKDLEQSLGANRKGDRINEHWVLMLDIDHFKKVNDTFGHDGGDAALRHVAAILKQCVREGDLICRWGGEEFAVVLKHSAFEGAQTVAERIRQEVQRQEFLVKREGAKEKERHPLTISIGASPFVLIPSQPRASSRSSSEINIHAEIMLQNIETSLTRAISEADAALYAAKQKDPDDGRPEGQRHPGRNRIIYRTVKPANLQ